MFAFSGFLTHTTHISFSRLRTKHRFTNTERQNCFITFRRIQIYVKLIQTYYFCATGMIITSSTTFSGEKLDSNVTEYLKDSQSGTYDVTKILQRKSTKKNNAIRMVLLRTKFVFFNDSSCWERKAKARNNVG